MLVLSEITTTTINSDRAAQIARRLATLYVSSRDRFVISKSDGTYVPRIGNRTMLLADSNLIRHVMCEYAVSVYSATTGSRFVSFDVDSGGLDTVKRVLDALMSMGVSKEDIHVSVSGRKGYHVEIFFDGLVRYSALYRFYKGMLKTACLDEATVECRPSPRCSIKLPLARHPTTGRMCWFLNTDNMTEVEDYDYVFGIAPMSADHFTSLCNALEDTFSDRRKEIQAALDEHQRGEGFDVLHMNMPVLREPGLRHRTTVRFAVALRYRSVPMESCAEILLHWMSKQNAEMYSSSQKEVFKDTWRIVRWVYKTASIRVLRSSNDVVISPNDMRRVLIQRSLLARKLYFFFVFNRHYKKAKRVIDIMELIGASRRSVYALLARMEEDGDVITKQGAVKRTQNLMFCKKANRYDIKRKPIPEEIEKAWPSDTLYHSFAPPETAEDFLSAYYGTIAALFPEADMASRLTKAEYQEYIHYNTTPKEART